MNARMNLTASVAARLAACASSDGLCTHDRHPLANAVHLHNVALAVGDLDAQVAWYEGMFGLHTAERGRFESVGADYAMVEGAGIRIELISRPAAPQRPVDRTPPPDHLGVLGWRALVLEVPDLAAATAWWRERGVEMLWADQPISAQRRATMLRDPEGNLVHVFGPPLDTSPRA